MTDREQLELAIIAQEQLRALVGDEVVDLTIASLREKLESLDAAPGADADAASGQRRRQATVLFADVSGFTALAESSDAEIVAEIMNDVWDRLDAVIGAFGGRIDKHIGDAVMALWGADVSSEDDPEQAVRAALDMQRVLSDIGHMSNRSLAMRVGVATGPVLLGEVGTTREFTAMGDTVNIAARLEHAAPVGGVLISHDTYRHVRGVFDVSPQGSLQLKGRREPVQGYVVHRTKPQTFRIPSRGVEGVSTRMVGRDEQLVALQTAFDAAVGGVGVRAVTLIGEGGVGKSRLVAEFANWIELLPAAVFYFNARALAPRQSMPYGVIRDLLASRFEILDTDAPLDVAAKLRRGFAPHLGVDEADLVGHWLGFDLPPSEAVDRLRGSSGLSNVCAAHIAEFFHGLASANPTLIVLEDLHWADEESLDLIERLIEWMRDTPTFVLGAARPTLLDRRPAWLAACEGASRMMLSPLPTEACRALIDEVLQHVPVVPMLLADLIVERADGNPYFVEELIKMLIDDRVIVAGAAGEVWQVRLERLDPSSVPATLTGVLEARLDSLDSNERDALQRASVVGRVFWDAAVSALAPTRRPAETVSALDVARQRELIFRSERSTVDASIEYVFKHALLRDVTYETVLLRDRVRLHALAADWLSANSGDRVGEFLELIAEHRSLGGEPGAGAALFRSAGERALSSGRSSSARRLIERAMALWSDTDIVARAEMSVRLAEACCRMGDFGAADRALEAALAAVEDSSIGDALEAEACYLASWSASERGDRDREGDMLDRALQLAESVGGTVLIRVLLGQAWWDVGSGNIEHAERDARRALDLAEQADDASEIGHGYGTLGAVMSVRGDVEGSRQCSDRALALARSIGDLEAESLALGNLGVIHHLLADESGSPADYQQADDLYRAELDLKRRLGLSSASANVKANLAQTSIRLGRTSEARAFLADALATTLAPGSGLLPLFEIIVEADLRLHEGDLPGALPLLAAVAAHPALRASDRQEIDRVLARAGLSVDDLATRTVGEPVRDLGEIAAELLERYRRTSPVSGVAAAP